MRHQRFLIAAVLGVFGVAAAILGVALYSSYSVKASPPSLSDALNSIPSDYQFVSGINVQKFIASPYYSRLRQRQSSTPPVGSDLSAFVDQTGVDPKRDISYLVFAG